jgi:tetratricopeptide (TPR) repeat protein
MTCTRWVANRYEDALPLCKEELRRRKAKQDSDHVDLVGTLERLGVTLLRLGQYSEAEGCLRNSLDICKKKLPPNPMQFHWIRSLLGEALARQQKHAEAEELLLAGYEGIKAHYPIEHWLFRNWKLTAALEGLIQLYDAWGKKDKADEWRRILEQAKTDAKPLAKP